MGAAVWMMGAALAHPEAAAPQQSAGRSAVSLTDTRVGVGSTDRMAAREALLEAAETALARGMVAPAILGFEKAAMLLHAADSEMGLVRAWMQAGEYRRALAFSAHTSGAHRDAPDAAALYAWTLRLGGQTDFARKVLDEALQSAPDNAVLEAVHQALGSAAPTASELMLALPHRMAPQSTMQDDRAQPPPAAARLLSSGILLDQGRRALVPITIVDGMRQLWVRNGLGRTSAAVVEATPQAPDGTVLAVLRLSSPLQVETTPWAERDPFAGSPGFSVAYAAGSAATAAWPWLHQGFFGSLQGSLGARRLGIPLPANANGAAVFDSLGRLAGIAVNDTNSKPLLVPVSLLRVALRDTLEPTAPVPQPAKATGARMPIDEGYERAMGVTLQVIGLP